MVDGRKSIVERCGPTHIFEGYTLDKTNERYKILAHNWETSSCRKELVDWLDGNLLKSDLLNVDQCICTGIGSFTGSHDPNYPADCKRPMYQLAAFQTILEMLKRRFDSQEVYFQDPAFNTLDKEFLQSRGYRIVTSPEAYDRMTASTFLYAPCNEWFVVFKAIEVAHPALFIGNDVPEFAEYIFPYIEERQARKQDIMEKFMRDRASKAMPEFDLSTALNAVIIWKEEIVADPSMALTSTAFEKLDLVEESVKAVADMPIEYTDRRPTGDCTKDFTTSNQNV